jgi:hypothetical protein
MLKWATLVANALGEHLAQNYRDITTFPSGGTV